VSVFVSLQGEVSGSHGRGKANGGGSGEGKELLIERDGDGRNEEGENENGELQAGEGCVIGNDGQGGSCISGVSETDVGQVVVSENCVHQMEMQTRSDGDEGVANERIGDRSANAR